MRLPKWPPKDWRSFLALWFQLLGCAAIGALIIWQTLIFIDHRAWGPDTAAQRLDTLGWSHITLVVGFICLFVGFGLTIGDRTIKLSRDGFEASSDDDDDKEENNAASGPFRGGDNGRV